MLNISIHFILILFFSFESKFASSIGKNCQNIFFSADHFKSKNALSYSPESVKSDQFIKDRPLVEYILGLYSYSNFKNTFKGRPFFSFAQDLFNLKKDSLIIDFGDGTGTAMAGLFQSPQYFKSEGKAWFANEIKNQSQSALSKLIFTLISQKSNLFWSIIKTSWQALIRIGTSTYNSLWRPLDPVFYRHAKLTEDFLKLPIEDRPKALGISFSKQENILVKDTPSLKRLTDRYFEDIPINEIPTYQLGISYFGIFSYSTLLSQSLYKALSKLQISGHLYILGMQSHVELQSGQLITIETFLKNYGKGFNVYSRKIDNTSVVVIEKYSNEIELPKLKLLSTKGDYPPEFTFELTNEYEFLN